MNKTIGENGPESVVKKEAEHPLGENFSNNLINEIKIKEECLWNNCKEQEHFSIKTEFDIYPKTENGVEQIKEEPQKSEEGENIVFINESDIKKESEVFDDTALQLMNVMMPDATDIKDNEVISENNSMNVSHEELVSKHLESHQYTAKFEVTSEHFSHVCDVCKKVFKSELLLNRHKIIHGTTFPVCPYLCDSCGKSFIHESILNQHMIMHTGERPFTCNKCHKNFPYKSSLKKHMQIHREVLSFSCKVCEETYSHKSSLLRHVRLHKKNKYTFILPKIR